MANKTSNTGTLSFLIAVVGICGLIILASLFVIDINNQVEEIYGPPSQTLTPRDKFSLSTQLWFQQSSLLFPKTLSEQTQLFNIGLDEPVGEIIGRLAAKQLISDSNAFRNYLVYTGLDNQIQAGIYKLSSAMSPIQIANKIVDATPEMIVFTILPGWRLEEVAEAVPASGLSITTNEFLWEALHPPEGYIFLSNSLESRSVEGYLLPGSYELPRNISAEELIIILLNSFQNIMTDAILKGLSQNGFSFREGIILASIVEREAVVKEEQALIASVFINRLAIGMPLEADPTVQYALGYNSVQFTWWTNPLSSENLNIDSPYNTYLYPLFPPGPISNPSLSAILAVAFPEASTYFFFRAACDNSGRHNFSVTFEQHLAFACP